MPLEALKRLASWRPGRLAWNTAHAGGWNAIRVLLQAGTLVLMARVLGAEGYGLLAGTVAIYITFGQFAGLGTGTALVRHLARGGELHGKLLATCRAFSITGLMLFALVWPASVWLFGATLSPTTLACFAIAELIVAPTLLPFAYRYLASERLFVSGMLLTVGPAARFTAIAITAALGLSTLSAFAALYLGCFAAAAIVTAMLVWPRRHVGSMRYGLLATIREGLPFVVSSAAVTAGGELDKTIMLRSAGSALTGQYAAAYRIVQAAALPVNSLVLAVTPRLFKSTEGVNANYAITLVTVTIAYAVFAATLIWILAPLLPLLLGVQFSNSITLLRLMCALLVTSSVRQMIVAQLTASNRQHARNWIEGLAAILTILAMVLVIPSFGAVGAIIIAAAADVAVGIGSWMALTRRLPRPLNVMTKGTDV
jgi:O-antigen/teichoic acid export membrane protein